MIAVWLVVVVVAILYALAGLGGAVTGFVLAGLGAGGGVWMAFRR